MGLTRITGPKHVIDLKADDVRKGIAPPSLAVYFPAMAYFRMLAMHLLGVTALWNEQSADSIREAAASINAADDADWTQEDARQVLAAVGSVPGPSHVRVERLDGQGILLFRAVRPDAPGAQPLSYREGNSQPSISLLAALRPEGIGVPRGMCMEVPVSLVEDDDGLALAAHFHRGKLREAGQEAEEAPAQT